MRYAMIVAGVCAAALSGCYIEPQRAEVLVETVPPGASCTVSQLGRPLTVAEPTPAIALVDLAPSAVEIACRRHGFADAVVTLPGPPAPLPGYVPSYRSDIAHDNRVRLVLTPLPPGAPR